MEHQKIPRAPSTTYVNCNGIKYSFAGSEGNNFVLSSDLSSIKSETTPTSWVFEEFNKHKQASYCFV